MKKLKTLKLRSETILQLSPAALRPIVGGQEPQDGPCSECCTLATVWNCPSNLRSLCPPCQSITM
jgi:hypothetical protein